MASFLGQLRPFRSFFFGMTAGLACLLQSQASGQPFSAENLNHHEHFPTVASYRDFEETFAFYGQALPALKLGAVSQNPAATLRLLFGEQSLALLQGQAAQIAELTLQEISVALAASQGQDPAIYLRSFFEFTAVNRHTKEVLEEIGWEIRTRVQKQVILLHPQALTHLFGNYLGAHRGGSLSLSINARSFFESSSLLALQELLGAARGQFDFEMEYFVVLQRSRLLSWSDAEFAEFLGNLDRILPQSLIYGVDLVGSLHESSPDQFYYDAPTRVRFHRRFGQLMQWVSQNGLQFRLHGWESPQGLDGDFYHEFWRFLEQQAPGQMPQIFRIGHISALRTQDIHRFFMARRRLGIDFVFEANIDSNVQMHSREEHQLFRTIRFLDGASFPVVLGTDGIGIWGKQAEIRQIFRRLQSSDILNSAALRRLDLDMGALARLRSRGSRLNLPHRPALLRHTTLCASYLDTRTGSLGSGVR